MNEHVIYIVVKYNNSTPIVVHEDIRYSLAFPYSIYP